MQILGAVMLAVPFLGLGVWVARDIGVRQTIIDAGLLAAFVVWVAVGAWLATH